MKLNCWEVKKCGREAGGSKVAELGTCPAAECASCDGLNGGKNAGRICWALTGTLCGGKIQGSFAQKQLNCLACEVYKMVHSEEGAAFKLMVPGK